MNEAVKLCVKYKIKATHSRGYISAKVKIYGSGSKFALKTIEGNWQVEHELLSLSVAEIEVQIEQALRTSVTDWLSEHEGFSKLNEVIKRKRKWNKLEIEVADEASCEGCGSFE